MPQCFWYSQSVRDVRRQEFFFRKDISVVGINSSDLNPALIFAVAAKWRDLLMIPGKS
jgi:hypothetical protein